MATWDTWAGELCRELGIGRWTLYRYVDARGEIGEQGMRVLGKGGSGSTQRARKEGVNGESRVECATLQEPA